MAAAEVGMKRLIMLSGPSGAGKGPLDKARKKFFGNLNIGEIKVIKSFESRKDGILRSDDKPEDFMHAADILKLDRGRYIIGDCRGCPQAIDIERARAALEANNVIFLEAYYTLGQQVRGHKVLDGIEGLKTTSLFMSPLSMKEIQDLQAAGVDLRVYLTYLMMNKIMNRTRLMGADEGIAETYSRAHDSIKELSTAPLFHHVMVNHDGEGSTNWHFDYGKKDFTQYPEGDAGRVLEAFVKFLRTGRTEAGVFENWQGFNPFPYNRLFLSEILVNWP